MWSKQKLHILLLRAEAGTTTLENWHHLWKLTLCMQPVTTSLLLWANRIHAHIPQKLYAGLFPTAWFTDTKDCIQSECTPSGEWYILRIKYYLASKTNDLQLYTIWMNLINIILSQRSQTWMKSTLCNLLSIKLWPKKCSTATPSGQQSQLWGWGWGREGGFWGFNWWPGL